MNFVRLIENLYRKSGGWENFALGDAPLSSDALLDMLEDAAPKHAPQDQKKKPGRRAVLMTAVRRGQSLAATQQALSEIGAPQLYSRNLQDASVIFLLKLCPDLKAALDLRGKDGEKFRLSLLDQLQEASRRWKTSHRHLLVPSQQAALDRLAGSIDNGICRFQDLKGYVESVFDRKDGQLLTQSVTGRVGGAMAEEVDLCRQALAALDSPDAGSVQACVQKRWLNFLDRSGPDFVLCQINALNYLVRALVRALQPVMESLADLSWSLRPRDEKDTFAMRMNRALYRLEATACNQWSYYDLLSLLFVSGQDGDGLYDTLKTGNDRPVGKKVSPAPPPGGKTVKKPKPSRPRIEIRSELPQVLQPLFLFDHKLMSQLNTYPCPLQDAERMGQTAWGALKLSRTGLARLLLFSFGEVEKETLENAGAFLFRVLKGQADLPRESFLLLLFAAESLAGYRWPGRESLAQRLNSPASGSLRDLLQRCGYAPLDPASFFDGAVIAVLGLGEKCPADYRPLLLHKTAALCARATDALHDRDCGSMLAMLAREAEAFDGQTGLEQAFAQLENGRDAPLFVYRA